MKIGFDMDEVLANFQSGFIEFFNSTLGRKATFEDIFDYSYCKVFNITPEEADRLVAEFYATEEFMNILPPENALDVLSQLRDKHTLYVVTSRPEYIKDKTITWLDANFPKLFADIILTGQSFGGNTSKITKGDICKQYGISLFVEDAPVYATQIVRTSNSKVLLLDKPWNRQQQCDDKLVRIYSLADLLHHLDES